MVLHCDRHIDKETEVPCDLSLPAAIPKSIGGPAPEEDAVSNLASSSAGPRFLKRALLTALLGAASLSIVAICFARSTSKDSPPPALMFHTETEMWGPTSVGTLHAYVGSAHDLPKTWLPCEGQTLRQENYPNLFRVLGRHWTNNEEGAGDFSLPDYRGMMTLNPEFLDGIRTSIAIAGAGEISVGVAARQITWVIKAMD